MSESAPQPEPIKSGPIEPVEIIRVTTKRIACDGGGGALGHPRVWLHLDENDQIACPYCSRLYVMEGAEAALSDTEENRST